MLSHKTKQNEYSQAEIEEMLLLEKEAQQNLGLSVLNFTEIFPHVSNPVFRIPLLPNNSFTLIENTCKAWNSIFIVIQLLR